MNSNSNIWLEFSPLNKIWMKMVKCLWQKTTKWIWKSQSMRFQFHWSQSSIVVSQSSGMKNDCKLTWNGILSDPNLFELIEIVRRGTTTTRKCTNINMQNISTFRCSICRGGRVGWDLSPQPVFDARDNNVSVNFLLKLYHFFADLNCTGLFFVTRTGKPKRSHF